MVLHNKFQSELQAWIPGHQFPGRVSSIIPWKSGKLFRQPVEQLLHQAAFDGKARWASLGIS